MKAHLALGLLCAAMFLAAPAQAGSNWTGCYVGAAAGYATATTEASLDVATFPSVATIDGLSADDASITGQVGCDAQLSRVVLGVWGSYTVGDLETSVSLGAPLPGGDLFNVAIEDRWAIGARAGYLLSNDVLLYGLVGYTEAKTSSLDTPLFGASFAVPDLEGIIYGGGVELSLTDGLYLQVQYTYADYNDAQIGLIAAPPVNLNFETHVQEVRLGLSYKYDFWSAR